MKLQVTARPNHNYKLLYAARQKFVIAGNFCVAHHGLCGAQSTIFHRPQINLILEDWLGLSVWLVQPGNGALFVICCDGLYCSLHIYHNFIMYLISWRNCLEYLYVVNSIVTSSFYPTMIINSSNLSYSFIHDCMIAPPQILLIILGIINQIWFDTFTVNNIVKMRASLSDK